jgi:hypothetical protein
LIVRTVGDAVEGVARAEGAEVGVIPDGGLDFVDGAGFEEIGGGVGVVPCPVSARRGLGVSDLGVEHTRQNTASDGGG